MQGLKDIAATVGLVSENTHEFLFEDTIKVRLPKYSYEVFNYTGYNRYNFTGFTDTKADTNGMLAVQLKKELKKMLYSRRKSAKEFYEGEKNGTMLSQHID